MSNLVPTRPRIGVSKRAFTIVASQYNARYVQGLVNHATEELRTLMPGVALTLYQVPGAFEIPVVVNEIAMNRKPDAIIAIGVILKGGTTHAENLSSSVTNALQQIVLEHGVPIINAVLAMENEEQARERCLEPKINRGIEAARAAMHISNVMAELRPKQS